MPSDPKSSARDGRGEAYALLRHYKEECAAYVAQLEPDDPEHAAAAERIWLGAVVSRCPYRRRHSRQNSSANRSLHLVWIKRASKDNRPSGWRDLTMLVSASVLCVSDPCNCYRTRNTSWAKVQRSLEPMSPVISAFARLVSRRSATGAMQLQLPAALDEGSSRSSGRRSVNSERFLGAFNRTALPADTSRAATATISPSLLPRRFSNRL